MNGADLAVIEGVMGLFDGYECEGNQGSTAHIATLLRAPIILILDVWGMGRSAAAVVEGCRRLLRGTYVSGVILNKIASEGHADICKRAVEAHCGVKVVGALPNDPSISLPERHLGLIPTQEDQRQQHSIERIADFVSGHVDLDRIIEIAHRAPPLARPVATPSRRHVPRETVRIAIANDPAFTFYYHDALDTLRNLGAELVPFSPIYDNKLPQNIQGMYLGGGFPEVFGKQLQANTEMRRQIAKAAEDECPIIAECGGLMYLTRSITDFAGKTYRMVGLVDASTHMIKKLTLNYAEAELTCVAPLGLPAQRLRGHEYHFSKLEDIPKDARFAYRMLRGLGITTGFDGWINYQTVAQYMHLHLAGAPRAASRLIQACRKYARK